MTGEERWKLMTMDKWTIADKKDDVREEAVKMTFDKPGTSYPYVPGSF